MSTTASPDFGISRIREDINGNILELLVHRFESDNSLTGLGWFSKLSIINHIEQGYSYITITKEWYRGEDIRVVSTVYGKYLRTDSNNTAKDNLGNLPKG